MAIQSRTTIAALRHRIQAERLWTPAAQEAFYMTPDPKLPPRQRNRAIKAQQAARELFDSLFPEDD